MDIRNWIVLISSNMFSPSRDPKKQKTDSSKLQEIEAMRRRMVSKDNIFLEDSRTEGSNIDLKNANQQQSNFAYL